MLRKAAREEGATVLLVSHDPRIKRWADRILDLEDGRLVEDVDAEPIAAPAGRTR
jgi:putative ABC transport system ATP-binding protein